MKNILGQVDSSYLAETAVILSPLKLLSYDRLNIVEGDNILDVGCGLGIDAVAIAERIGKHGTVTGIDHDTKMLSVGSAKIKERPSAHVVNLIQGCASKLPFQSNSFDGCRSERLFSHLTDPESVLSEMIRVTKPEGRIVIVDTDWSSLSIDNPLPSIERTLLNYRLSHVAINGYAGRSLYRYCRQNKLGDIEVEVFPVCITDIEVFYFISMEKAVEDQAFADHVLTRQELDFWRAELKRAAADNCFYCSANVVMVSATKPKN